MKKPTQAQRILQILRNANGGWVSGQLFNDPPVRISQYHARIFELQKHGHEIEPSKTTNEYGFKSYRLIREPLTSNVRDFLDKWGTKTKEEPKGLLF